MPGLSILSFRFALAQLKLTAEDIKSLLSILSFRFT